MTRPIQRSLALCMLVGLAACSAFMHGYTLSTYQHRMLPAGSSDGAYRLGVERRVDRTLRNWITDHGEPDYLYVEDVDKVQLLYLDEGQLITFERPRFDINSGQAIPSPIPDFMLALLPAKDRTRSSRAAPIEPTPTSPVGAAASGGTGTCFAVSPAGLLVTAGHVVKGADSVQVRLFDGRILPARVQRTSALTELVTLQIDASTPEYLVPARPGSISPQQAIFTFGFPVVQVLNPAPQFSVGSVTALSGPGGDATLMQIAVPVQRGNSGGPLVTETGDLAGVVLSTARVAEVFSSTGGLPQDAGWGVRAEYVTALLGESGPVVPTKSREAAIERAKRATCFVEATRGS